jgi:hypothetical protein
MNHKKKDQEKKEDQVDVTQIEELDDQDLDGVSGGLAKIDDDVANGNCPTYGGC